MEGLTHSTLLRRDALDDRDYFDSLVDASIRLGLMDEDFLNALRRSMRHLLSRQCAAFTGGRSASVRTEVAQNLEQSIHFTLGACFQTMEPLDALAMLRHCALERCYEDGRKRVDALVRAAELSWMAELRRPLPVENDLLSDTLRGGFAGFFKLYNPEYGAHEIHITADYPVLYYPTGYRGIAFIQRYLDNLILENRFLRSLPAAAVHNCLSLYALRNDSTLRELCDNLFLTVLACALPAQPNGSAETAGAALLDRLGCDSGSLRSYVLRVCRERAVDLARIRRLMNSASGESK